MRTVKCSFTLAAALMLGGALATGSALAAYPSAKQPEIAKTAH